MRTDMTCALGIGAMNNASPIEALRTRLADLHEEARTIQALADSEHRDFTADEEKQLDGIFALIQKVTSDIERRETIARTEASLNASAGRKASPMVPKVAAAPIDHADSRKHGFRNVGEFAIAVRKASSPGNTADPRLFVNGPAEFGSEGSGPDGGFLVPPEFRTTIVQKVMGEESLLSRTDLLETNSNSLTIPVDETTAWQTSGGILAAWEGEGNQFSPTKPSFNDATVKLNKLTALVPVTDELLEDSAALASYIGKKAPEKILFKVNNAIVNGTGVGQPLGILNGPALVTQAKESGQTAATVVFQNIVNMWSRLYAPARQNAVWLINQDIEPQLFSLAFPGSSTVLPFPVYLPPGGLASSPYATLMGRPVIPSQACQALGNAGDIILTDLKAYLAAQKVGGIRAEVSIHLWFDYDMTAFRFVLRIAGQPWYQQTIAPFNDYSVNPTDVGPHTLSHYVCLQTRS